MKVINIILTVLFALFAIVQFNDPDPWLWVAIYGLVAGVSGFAIYQKYSKGVIYTGIAICVIGLGILFPELINWIRMGMPNIAEGMKAEKPHIEFTREFGGLGMSLVVLLFHFFQMRKKK
jgi:hypothetical protein